MKFLATICFFLILTVNAGPVWPRILMTRQTGGNQSASSDCGNKSIIAVLNRRSEFSLFSQILNTSALVNVSQMLQNSTMNFTVFAPTNQAILSLSPAQMFALNQSKELLNAVVKFHIVNGTKFNTSSLPVGQPLDFPTLLNGTKVNVFNAGGGQVIVDGSASLVPPLNLQACNGVIDGISQVLDPFPHNTLPTSSSTLITPTTATSISTGTIQTTLPGTSTLSGTSTQPITITGSVVTTSASTAGSTSSSVGAPTTI